MNARAPTLRTRTSTTPPRKAASQRAGYSSESHPNFGTVSKSEDDGSNNARKLVTVIVISIIDIAMMIYVTVFHLVTAIVAALPDQVRKNIEWLRLITILG